MSREIETKYRLSQPEPLLSLMQTDNKLTWIRSEFEQNTLLDDSERRLFSKGCGLRVRRAIDQTTPENARCKLTFKGPRDADPALAAARVRSREELETTIGDAETLLTLLERLGFSPVVYYEKRRSTWKTEGVEIVVDELPQLGWFAEIEAASVELLEEWRQRLDIPIESAEPQTYVKLTAEHGQQDANGVYCLKF